MAIGDPKSNSNRRLVDEALREGGFGSRDASMYNLIHGIHSLNKGVSPAPVNRDSTGYTFFTKPMLNLTYNNIRYVRKLEFLGDPNTRSMGCAIKCMLTSTSSFGGGYVAATPRSEHVDDRNPFVSLLSNTLMTLTGFPDSSLDTFTSEEGYAKEAMTWADGRTQHFGPVDLTAEFRNVKGDPVTTFYIAYLEYMSRVQTDHISPHAFMMTHKYIDYMMAIYRLVMDESDRFVQKIGVVPAAFPTATPDAAAFNVNREKAFTDANATVSIPFRGNGFISNDPIVAWAFNQSVYGCWPGIKSACTPLVGENFKYRGVLDGKCLPLIDEETYELVWWAPNDLFATAKNLIDS